MVHSGIPILMHTREIYPSISHFIHHDMTFPIKFLLLLVNPLWAQEVRNLIFKKAATCSHLFKQPLAATCCQVAAWASGCKWLPRGCQVAAWASGCLSKWLPSGCQVAASGCKWLLFRKSKWCTFARSLGEPLFWLVKSRCNLTMILILLDTIDLGVYSGTQPALHGTYRHAQLDEHLSDCIDRYTVNTKNRRLEFHQSYFSMSP